MSHQSVELGIWLGFAGIGIIWANFSLWRTRRVLSRIRQNVLTRIPQNQVKVANMAVSSAVAESSASTTSK